MKFHLCYLTPGWNFHPGMKHHFSSCNRNFSFISGLKQKIPSIQKIILIKIKIFKFSSGDETSHIILKILSQDEKSPYNLPLDLITNYDDISIITMRWAVDILKFGAILTKKVMKSFYVAWSDEPDLKLAWSSETALFKLLALFGESFFQ